MLADRVKETTTTTGTGTVNLGGAATGGYQTFVAGIGTGNLCYYCIQLTSANEWEVGIGTVTDAATDTLSRDTVLSSSNGGVLVNFSSGTKDVFCTSPASLMEMKYQTGSMQIPTGTARIQIKNITITGTNRIIVNGTGRLSLKN